MSAGSRYRAAVERIRVVQQASHAVAAGRAPRWPRIVAQADAELLISLLGDACERVEIVGSLRRRLATVKDIELLVVPKLEPTRNLLQEPSGTHDLVEHRLHGLINAGLIAEHEDRAHRCWGPRQKRFGLIRALERDDADDPSLWMWTDLFCVRAPAEWGVLHLIRTGPAEFSREMVTRLHRFGLRCLDGRIIDHRGLTVPCPTEERFFELVELPYLAPELRFA